MFLYYSPCMSVNSWLCPTSMGEYLCQTSMGVLPDAVVVHDTSDRNVHLVDY